MARYHGKNGKAVVGGVDKVNEVNDWTLDVSKSLSDASSLGNDFTNSVLGQYTGNVNLTCAYDPSDSDGQEAMVTAHFADTKVTLTLYELPPATGVKYWSGDFWVEKFGEKVPVGGKVERSFSLRLDSALTRSTVP
jgi:hypothetical protein